jgi:hypothetical protein
MSKLWACVSLASAVLLASCSSGADQPPAGGGKDASPADAEVARLDAGIQRDAGFRTDATASDAAANDADDLDAVVDEDAATADAIAADAEPMDATLGRDATAMDARAMDATASDALPRDAIAPDATPEDATAQDATSPDAMTDAGTVLILAGGAGGILAGEFHGSTWSTSMLTDTTLDVPAIAFNGPSSAIGVVRSTSNMGELHYTTWAPGAFSALTPIAAGVTTRAAPSLVGSSARTDLAFQGDDFNHYFSSYTTSWVVDAEPVSVTGSRSFGPSAPAITAMGMTDVVAFAGNDGNLYDQSRVAGAWMIANGRTPSVMVTLSPAIVALESGPELMIAFVQSTDSKIMFTTRTAGTWSAPAQLDANGFTLQSVALTALAGGGAVITYRGLDGNIYWSRYATATGWTPASALVNPNFATSITPAVTAGAGADAELAFINTVNGSAYHARLTGGTWSTPTLIGGAGLTAVAIARSP